MIIGRGILAHQRNARPSTLWIHRKLCGVKLSLGRARGPAAHARVDLLLGYLQGGLCLYVTASLPLCPSSLLPLHVSAFSPPCNACGGNAPPSPAFLSLPLCLSVMLPYPLLSLSFSSPLPLSSDVGEVMNSAPHARFRTGGRRGLITFTPRYVQTLLSEIVLC